MWWSNYPSAECGVIGICVEQRIQAIEVPAETWRRTDPSYRGPRYAVFVAECHLQETVSWKTEMICRYQGGRDGQEKDHHNQT